MSLRLHFPRSHCILMHSLCVSFSSCCAFSFSNFFLCPCFWHAFLSSPLSAVSSLLERFDMIWGSPVFWRWNDRHKYQNDSECIGFKNLLQNLQQKLKRRAPLDEIYCTSSHHCKALAKLLSAVATLSKKCLCFRGFTVPAEAVWSGVIRCACALLIENWLRYVLVSLSQACLQSRFKSNSCTTSTFNMKNKARIWKTLHLWHQFDLMQKWRKIASKGERCSIWKREVECLSQENAAFVATTNSDSPRRPLGELQIQAVHSRRHLSCSICQIYTH